MRTHVVTVSSCFAILRLIRSIRRSVSTSALKSLVVSLILTQMDTRRPTTLAARQTSICHKCYCTLGILRPEIRPHHSTVTWPSLVAHSTLIEYRLAVLAYHCQPGLAPSYLSTQPHKVSDVESTVLLVPRTHHQTIGDRAFPVAAACVWNSLSPAVTMSTSLSSFQRNLKTELFARSYPDAWSPSTDHYDA